MADDHDAARGFAAAAAGTKYRARIHELGEAGADLHALLTVLVANCDRVVRELDDGRADLDSVRSVADEEARAFRRDVNAAMTRFEQAMQASRGESLRVLVRDGGMSVTDLARTIGLSAQMVRRLLRTAEDA
jgi:alanyl-tRNA synthetase